MRLRQNSLVGVLVILILSVMVGSADATILISDANLLSGMSAAGSSVDEAIVGAPWPPEAALDGKAVVTAGVQCDWVDGDNDVWPRLAVWGFSSPITTIRIWGAADLDPNEVMIRSSTSLVAPTTGSFAANLGDSFEKNLLSNTQIPSASWIAGGSAGDLPWPVHYVEYSVNAPTGTQSLYFDFGTSGKTRICEVQAFFVPEPGTLLMLALSLLGLLAYAWQKRK